MFKTFTGGFCLFYFGQTGVFAAQFISRRKKCSSGNAIYFLSSVLLAIVGGSLVTEIRAWNWTHGNQEFLKQCEPQARGIIADIDASYK